MKKLISLAAALLFAVSLTACAAGGENTSQPEGQSAAPDVSDAAEENTAEAPGANTLVVYFSATGNTKRAAELIAQAAGGELFELEPEIPYTDEDLDYNDENSRVSREHADESLRNVDLKETAVSGWENISVVYIGYPLWWGTAAWPVNSFVSANDFTGKTVIPFCTSGSSGIGNSGRLLAEEAGSGTWLEGRRFGADITQAQAQEWVESLDLN